MSETEKKGVWGILAEAIQQGCLMTALLLFQVGLLVVILKVAKLNTTVSDFVGYFWLAIFVVNSITIAVKIIPSSELQKRVKK